MRNFFLDQFPHPGGEFKIKNPRIVIPPQMAHPRGGKKFKFSRTCSVGVFVSSLATMSVAKQPTLGGFWDCKRCTVENPMTWLSCSCCGTRKPRVVSQKGKTKRRLILQPGKKSKKTQRQQKVIIYWLFKICTCILIHVYYYIFDLHSGEYGMLCTS